MRTPPNRILAADWSATPLGVRAGFLELVSQLQSQQQENDLLRQQLTDLATELAGLRELIRRNSRNSSKWVSPSLTRILICHGDLRTLMIFWYGEGPIATDCCAGLWKRSPLAVESLRLRVR